MNIPMKIQKKETCFNGYTVTIQEETEKVTQAVVHKSVEITDGQYGHYIYKKDEMIYIPCGGAVYVKNAITEVETCKQYLTLYFDSGDGKRRTILFPREDLVENKIVSLTAYGVQVSKTEHSRPMSQS